MIYDLRESWGKKAVDKMVCHNNYAERPLVIVKGFWHMHPTLSLNNLSWLGHSMVNEAHRCADVFGPLNELTASSISRLAGTEYIHSTNSQELKRAVKILCSVRRKTIGRITGMQREAHTKDKAAQVITRKLKAI
jgi:hypothetical protein